MHYAQMKAGKLFTTSQGPKLINFEPTESKLLESTTSGNAELYSWACHSSRGDSKPPLLQRMALNQTQHSATQSDLGLQ